MFDDMILYIKYRTLLGRLWVVSFIYADRLVLNITCALLFQVLYAKEPDELEAAKEDLRALPHESYVRRVEAFLQCEEQWVLLYRAGTVTRGQNTNNYSEASIRILKDVVLSRTKAYNAVALVEFVAETWEKYLENKIMRHANHMEPSHRISFESLFHTALDIDSNKIVQIDQALFHVPSSSGNALYEVQADFGLCSCWAGRQGSFCKHQAIVQKTFGGVFPNSPELTLEDCAQLGQLALGDRCPPRGFFMPLVPQASGSGGPGPSVRVEPHCEGAAATAAEYSWQPPALEAHPTPEVSCSTAAIRQEHASSQSSLMFPS